MPLYMDIHKVETDAFTVEDVVVAHMKDLAIQERYGVVQVKYWVNVEDKTIFCLMEGPSKEACNEVHKQSHGNTPCNIIEVSDDEFNLYLGTGKSIDDLAHTEYGEVDTGYRTILLADIVDLTCKYDHFFLETKKLIEKYKGVPVLQPDDSLMASFVFASNAILCALEINKLLKPIQDNLEFVITLVNGKPVDEYGNKLFEETKEKAKYLSAVGSKKIMYIDSETKSLSLKEPISPKIRTKEFKTINSDDFNFLFKLFNVLDKQLTNPDFKSAKLYKLLGLSKSQAYRKIKSLTEIAPNQLIQELRLRRSLKELKQNRKTVAEIAYDLGFNSPAYFTKSFRKRFATTPSTFAKTNRNISKN